MRKLIVLVVILVIISAFWRGISRYLPKISPQPQEEKVKIVTEESVVIDAVKNFGPSVVTVAEEQQAASTQSFNFGPFSVFSVPDQTQPTTPQNIGSGFIVSKDGLIVTNKHVVSDVGAKYKIITNDDKKYNVLKIYRDPLNDIAILKIDPSENKNTVLKPVELGDSSNLQVGQFVIAIGTALGEFRNTVTTGVISGLGRGITAGSELQGYIEKLDNVIQTNAAINPGNSGGPLLNSKAQVIGINTAIAQSGQNIGFALPVNVVKDSLKNFNDKGQFNRPYLGVAYKMINRDVALLNNVPQGAYIQSVVASSPAEKAGLLQGDIVIKMDNNRIQDQDSDLAKEIAGKKVGDTVTIAVWRDGKTKDFKVTLTSAPNQ